MGNNRREFSENEKLILFNEVNGRCPICGDILIVKRNAKFTKLFEVAHIYPANPLLNEVELLKNERRLSDDVNDLKNVMAVCRKCHKVFDTPRTVDEYRKWHHIKTKLIQNEEIKKNTQFVMLKKK